MPTCPNKSLKSWKSLDEKVPSISNYIWDKLEGNINDYGEPINNTREFSELFSKNNKDYIKTWVDFINNKFGTATTIQEAITAEEVLRDFPKSELTSEDEKTLVSDLAIMDNITEIKNTAVERLERRLKLNERFKNIGTEQLEEQKEFVAKLAKLDAEKALVDYVKQAVKTINKQFTIWETN
jgi:hypothetical protein